MSRFNVRPEKEASLLALMERLEVKESDLDESFVRSSGPGGQHVNKTSTCVRLVHRPTGVEVKVQTSRSQNLNRFLARRLVCEKIEEQLMGTKSASSAEAERRRKQKARRARRRRSDE